MTPEKFQADTYLQEIRWMSYPRTLPFQERSRRMNRRTQNSTD